MHQQPSPPNGPYGPPAGQHPYGEVPLPSGTILVTIKADGVWSFKKS